MTELAGVESFLSPPMLIACLMLLGLVVGVLTGLFGVGGAFVVVPLIHILLGIPYTLATGSSMSFTIGASTAGLGRHLHMGNVAVKTMLILAGAAVCGTVLGADLHHHLHQTLGGAAFDRTMNVLFFVTLLGTAWLVFAWRPHEVRTRSLLQRLPLGPKIEIRRAGIKDVSLPGLCAVGLSIGVLKGLLGIGGGVLFMPLMLLVVGLTVQHAVGTSLGVVLLSSIAGAIIYGQKGQASLWIVMPLLVGSSLGIQLGSYLCQRLHAQRIGRYFAVFVLLVAVAVGYQLLR
jgi:uncharacterized membrane protein YfcA